MYKKMCHRITATISIVVALALAITVSIWHQQALTYIIYVTRFFDIMLPVLAVGALIKYLICGSCTCHHNDESCSKGR